LAERGAGGRVWTEPVAVEERSRGWSRRRSRAWYWSRMFHRGRSRRKSMGKGGSRKGLVESRKGQVESKKGQVESSKRQVESRKRQVESRKTQVESRMRQRGNRNEVGGLVEWQERRGSRKERRWARQEGGSKRPEEHHTHSLTQPVR